MKQSLAMLSMVLMCILTAHSIAQEKATPQEPGLSEYDITQFIIAEGPSPRSVMGLDNNGEILLACRGGKTTAQLEAAGVTVIESQLFLLEIMRLLEEREGVYSTALPILDSADTAKLRERTSTGAASFATKIAPLVKRLLGELDSRDMGGSAYTILFSFVLDGLVWDKFAEKGIIGERKITAEEPFWSGVVYAVYPPRKFSCGTNSISEEGVALKVNWTDAIIRKMLPFIQWQKLAALYADIKNHGRIIDPTAKETFAPFALFDEDGNLTVPTIQLSAEDVLNKISNTIAAAIADEVSNRDYLAWVENEYAVNRAEAVVIFYHEYMWDLLDQLVERDLVEMPRAFADPENARPEDIGRLVFVVRNEKK